MTVVRQVIEPKIVGKSLGVHPILSLVTLYVGFQLFGIVGMIFLPIVTIIFLSKPDTEKEE
jgi:predicted PurR-regulated permease PerM